MAVLTDTKARHIKPDDKPLPHGGITGLTLHPSSVKGRGKWVFRYVSPVTQKRRNAGLGTYPEVSIAEAARAARIMREQHWRLKRLKLKKLLSQHLPMQPGVYMLNCHRDGKIQSMSGSGYRRLKITRFLNWEQKRWIRLRLRTWQKHCVQSG